MTEAVVVGLDIGGTKIAGALVEPTGRIRYELQNATPWSDDGADLGLTATRSLAVDLSRHAQSRHWRVIGVGAGVPEYVDHAGRLTSREVLAWNDQPRDLLATVYPDLPCAVESDVRCGAVAEWRLGAAAGAPGLFYVSLGTGLASTAIVDGHVVRGARGEALALGEFGVPVGVSTTWQGNLEEFASGHGIAARYSEASGIEATARQIVARSVDGELLATTILESAGRAIGTVLADIVALLDPPVIVLGGGLGAEETALSVALRSAYDERTTRRPAAPALCPAGLGGRAGVVGAALIAVPGSAL